jgi:hypothetical protein
MGLYFEGEEILEEEMLEKLLGIPEPEQALNVTYTCEPLEHSERLWLWTNIKTGKAVITGDEGNGWCIPLIIADSKEEAIAEYIRNPPKARYRNLFEALEAIIYQEGNEK